MIHLESVLVFEVTVYLLLIQQKCIWRLDMSPMFWQKVTPT